MGQKFQCLECEYQATQKSHLVTHQKSVHMGQKFQCPDCEYKATEKGSLKKHEQSVHMVWYNDMFALTRTLDKLSILGPL